jgi:hypothetical protein
LAFADTIATLRENGDTIMERNQTDKHKQMSWQELICSQVYGLVRETADAICPEGMSVIEIEADLLDALAATCAAKRDVARALLKGMT